MTDASAPAPLTSNERRRASRVAQRLYRADRFIDGADVGGTPDALRGDRSRTAWKALTASERRAHLIAFFEADEAARDTAKREARRRARAAEQATAEATTTATAAIAASHAPTAPVPASVPAPSRPRNASPYLVVCADGCGEFVASPSHRPSLRYLPGHAPAEVAATRARAARLARAAR